MGGVRAVRDRDHREPAFARPRPHRRRAALHRPLRLGRPPGSRIAVCIERPIEVADGAADRTPNLASKPDEKTPAFLLQRPKPGRSPTGTDLHGRRFPPQRRYGRSFYRIRGAPSYAGPIRPVVRQAIATYMRGLCLATVLNHPIGKQQIAFPQSKDVWPPCQITR